MSRLLGQRGAGERHLLLRPPFVEALAVDPLGGARAEAGRDERLRLLLGEADSAHRRECLQVSLAARRGESAHFVCCAREPTRGGPSSLERFRYMSALVCVWFQVFFCLPQWQTSQAQAPGYPLLPHHAMATRASQACGRGHETTMRATSPGAAGLLCTDARVRGPCDAYHTHRGAHRHTPLHRRTQRKPAKVHPAALWAWALILSYRHPPLVFASPGAASTPPGAASTACAAISSYRGRRSLRSRRAT